MTLINDLQAISKELTKLASQTEKLAATLGKTEKPKAKSVTTKTKAKAVITKKAPVTGVPQQRINRDASNLQRRIV